MRATRKTFRPLILTMLTLLVCAGCRGYGTVSPAAYDYAMALYSISNRRAEHKLDEVGAQIASARTQGELTGQEADWLIEIVSDARQGDWESANRASRQIMEDQVH